MKKIILLALLPVIIGFAACSQTGNGEASEENTKEPPRVLFVLTSHDELGDTGEKTGFWLEEFAAPYYTLHDKGVKITVASPEGGRAPIDPRSASEENQTEATRRFNKDTKAQSIIENTVELATVRAENYDAVFYPGGHGPLWDLAESETSVSLIESFNKQKKPMAFVCHAPGVLKNVQNVEGDPFVKGKKVTGFTNSEEKAVQLINVVPFLLEDMLKKKGGIYIEAKNWTVNVVQDGHLITGQNPSSSEKAAELLYSELN
ncbi:MAG TPA: type 1 glutamine amidotransferase domain-containing protein [Cryomorphaceae bacterium]|nr:type 1 glutamine amidotransferase domain-containing protein [Cryomorphaceae bacterium]